MSIRVKVERLEIELQENNKSIPVVNNAVEYQLRCKFNSDVIQESWNGASKPWRNTHPRTDNETKDDGSVSSKFASVKTWFSETAHLKTLSASSVTSLGSSQLHFEMYHGQKSKADDPLIASGKIDLASIYQGDNYFCNLALIAGENSGIGNATVRVSIELDETLLDYVMDGTALSVGECVIPVLPAIMYQDFMDDEKFEVEVEAIQSAFESSDSTTVQVQIFLISEEENVDESKENDEEKQGESKENETETDESKKNETEKVMIANFKMQMVFDTVTLLWSAVNESSGMQRKFVPKDHFEIFADAFRRNALVVMSRGDLRVTSVFDFSQLPRNLHLHQVSACGSTEISLSLSRPFVPFSICMPASSLSVSAISKNAFIAKRESSKVLKRSPALEEFKRNIDSKYADHLRILLLQALRDDMDLFKIAKEKQILVRQSELISLLSPGNDAKPSLCPQMAENAKDAEYAGEYSRAEDLWLKCTDLDFSYNYEYALFCLRRHKMTQGVIILEQLPRTHEETADYAPQFITSLCNYQTGKELDFECLPGFFGSKKYLALAHFALDLNLDKVARKAIFLQSLDDSIDDAYVQFEIARASYKSFHGHTSVAIEILEDVLHDSESVCLLNVSKWTQARTHKLLGEFYEKQQEIQIARRSYSRSLQLLTSWLEYDTENQIQVQNYQLAILRRLGELSMQAKEFRKARIIFQNAVKIQSGLSWAWFGLGRASTWLGDLESANVALKRSTILDDTNSNVWGTYCALLLQCGDVAQAQFALQAALEYGFKNKDLLFYISQNSKDEIRAMSERRLDILNSK